MIEELINPDELISSTDVIDRLVARAGVSRTAARSRVFRDAAKDPSLWVTDKLVLPGRRRLFARTESTRQAGWIDSMIKLLRAEGRHGIARTLAFVRKHGPVPVVTACRVLAAPIKDPGNGRKPIVDRELEALLEIPGVSRHFAGRVDDCLTVATEDLKFRPHSVGISRKRDQIIASIASKMLATTGTISYDYKHPDVDSRGNYVLNNYPFSLVGMSWIGPLARQREGGKQVPTPVALDGYAHEVTEVEVEALFEKMSRCTSCFRTPIVGAIAAPRFQEQAFKLAKSRHMIVIPLSAVLGDIVKELLDLIETLRGKPIEEWGDEIIQLFQYSQESPLLADLRAFSLEALAAVYASVAGYSSYLSLGLRLPWKNTTRDLDVFGAKPDATQAVLIECKAHKAEKYLEAEDVTKFLTETVPAAIDFTKPKHDVGSYHVELWTTGRVSDEVRALFDKQAVRGDTTKALLDGDAVRQAIASKQRIKRAEKLVECIAGFGTAG